MHGRDARTGASRERQACGQATVEWTALIALIALVLALSGVVVSAATGWRFAEGILHAVVCAARGGGCDEGPTALSDAYGPERADTVRALAPNIVYERGSAQLPVDFRRCRGPICSDGPAAPTGIGSSHAGLPVTAFTRVVDRRASGGNLYIQYWLYYPESFSGGIGRKLGPLQHKWPGYHPDDWEAYEVRIGPDGKRSARASAHGRYKNFKTSEGWGPWTGYYRVSGGSHAGHLVNGPTGERSTATSQLRLVPIETLPDKDLYRFDVSPPWLKRVYRDPESPSS